MNTALLMVNRANEPVYDVEAPTDVPIEILADSLSQAFQWAGAYHLQVNGTNLPGHKTLAELGIWDGSQLIAVPAQRAAPQATQQTQRTQPLPPPVQIPQPQQRQPLPQPPYAPQNSPTAPATPAVRGMRSLNVPKSGQETPAPNQPQTPQAPAQVDEPTKSGQSKPSPVKGWRQTPPNQS